MSGPVALKQAIAQRLRQARELAGLSQGQVARLIGLHRPSLSEAEAGRRNVSAEELARLADLYKVSADWLVGRESRQEDPRVLLAARELRKLRKADRERLLELLGVVTSEVEP